MKHVVLGTAGHVDHGKTALVRRLTGVDTDRLLEEKKRGITIELGFAPFQLPDGTMISIIDVPGHEKFVKTMVAGVTGIDVVLMVIAADEGVMPQTREHLDILSLLGVERGVVAITKADLVEEEWMEMVTAEVHDVLQGSSLENSRIIPVSSLTGEGVDQLMEEIQRLSHDAEKGMGSSFLRLPIDRAFTISGHGTIVTGTLSGGRIEKGAVLEILPAHRKVRVRNVQVHGNGVNQAEAGERCALNLSDISKDEIERGDIIVSPGSLTPGKIMDAKVTAVQSVEAIKHGQRVRIHVGTSEVMGRIRMIGKDAIEGGETGYIQLRPESPIVTLRGDRFILRSYSPVITIGGGTILHHDAPNRPRFSQKTIEVLSGEEQGDPKFLIEMTFHQKPLSFHEIVSQTFLPDDIVQKTLEGEGGFHHFTAVDKWIPVESYQNAVDGVMKRVKDFYQENPFREGMEREELRSRDFSSWDIKDFNALLDEMKEKAQIGQNKNIITDRDDGRINALVNDEKVKKVIAIYREDGPAPRAISSISREVMVPQEELAEMLDFLQRVHILKGKNSEILFHREVIDQVKDRLRQRFIQDPFINAAAFRDMLGTNRKAAIALLEYFDAVGYTIRQEDVRTQGPKL